MFLQMRSLLFSALLLLHTSSTTYTVNAETVLLADCPQEPNVQGTFRNNGQYCVRDRVVISRDVIDATCPDADNDADDNDAAAETAAAGYVLKRGKCRRTHSKSVKPSCPPKYQRFGELCHKQCPSKDYRQKYKECILPSKTLGANYMTCNGNDNDNDNDSDSGNEQKKYHRYDAYCCIPGENCPQLQCNLGNQVPGKFFYTADGKCERQVETLVRPMTPRQKNNSNNGPMPPPPRTPTPTGESNNKIAVVDPCPSPGLVPIGGSCQEPCPYGFRSLKGKCELRSCVFDPMTERFVECPEATYKVSQSIF
jgi:hypothetical protein